MESKGADKKRQEKPKEKAKTLNLSQSLNVMINPKLLHYNRMRTSKVILIRETLTIKKKRNLR